MEIPKSGKMRDICHSELRRRGRSLVLQRDGKQSSGIMKKSKCSVNNYILGHSETTGQREDCDQTGLARFFPVYHT